MDFVWIVLDGEEKWTKPEGIGFIYRNLLGISRTKEGAFEIAKRKIDFLGAKERDRKEYDTVIVMNYKDRNYTITISKYNLDGASLFDINH